MKVMSSAKAVNILRQYEAAGYGGFFYVGFIKRTDGTIRFMRCRFHVHKFDQGGGRAYDPKEKKLFWVCDVEEITKQKKEGKAPRPYRSIPEEGIFYLRVDKLEIFVNMDEVTPKRSLAA